ncbi:MAG: hypothetical protein ACKOCX_09930 [Planctomycetota bacterium]
MKPTDTASPWPKTFAPVLWWVATTLVAITLAPLLWRCPQGHLDSSWGTVLWHAAERGLAFGRDIVFTYGPLGHVTTGGAADGPWAATFWTVTGFTWLAIAPVALLLRQRPWPLAAGLVVVLLALPWFVTGLDTLVPAGLMAWGILAITTDREPRLAWLGLATLAGLGGLMKFTWLVLGLVTVLAVVGDLVLRRRFRAATVPVLGGLAVFLTGWAVAGQSLVNLPAFLTGGWQLAAGYAKAMGMPGPRDVLLLQAAGSGLVLCSAAVAARHAALPAGENLLARRGLLGSWLAVLTFLAWKHGVLRAAEGDIHGAILAAWSVIACFSLTAIPTPRVDVVRLGVTRACAVAFLAIVLVHRMGFGPLEAHVVASPQRLVDHVRMLLGSDPRQAVVAVACPAKLDELALPAVKAIVGDASVDVFGHCQDYAIANGFAYTPRPVFQSYSAYSRWLDERNERFYLGDQGPRYSLLALEPIDGRFPPLEDALCLRAILKNYRLRGREEPFLVAERISAEPATLEQVAAGVARIGERVGVEGHDADDLWLEIELSPSLRGRLESLLVRPPRCGIRLWSDADPDTGRAWNAPAAMLAAGFIASPLLESTADVAAALTSGPTRRLRAFAVEAKRVAGGQYRWRLSALRGGLVGHPAAAQAAAEYPGFAVTPAACRSRTPTMIVEEAGTRMLKVDPPSEIVIDVPAEATTVEGAFAMLAAAYEEGATDGAEFIVACGPRAAEPQELSRRLLAPETRPEDRGVQRFSLPLPPGDERRLILRTTNGPADNALWDWACWADVRFGVDGRPPQASPAND